MPLLFYIVGYDVSIYLVYQQRPETELVSARPNVEIKAVKQLEDVPQGKLKKVIKKSNQGGLSSYMYDLLFFMKISLFHIDLVFAACLSMTQQVQL